MIRNIALTRAFSGVVAVVLGLGLTACGSSDDSKAGGHAGMSSTMPGMQATATPQTSITVGPAAEGDHNEADAEFAGGMISHHGQAIQMADVILAKTQNADIKALAGRIKAAQTLEIATMSGWLKGWKVVVPDPAATDAMTGMHGDHMMSADDLAELEAASGSAADQMFLRMMPEHHEGAIVMAQEELTSGTNPTAKALAQKIIGDQTAEIAEMKSLLSKIS